MKGRRSPYDVVLTFRLTFFIDCQTVVERMEISNLVFRKVRRIQTEIQTGGETKRKVPVHRTSLSSTVTPGKKE